MLNQHKTLLEDLRAQIIEDFDSSVRVFIAPIVLTGYLTQIRLSLFQSCLMLRMRPMLCLGSYGKDQWTEASRFTRRSEILSRFVRRLLEPYERLFSISALTPKAAGAALEEIDRRFSWLKRVLREFDPNYGKSHRKSAKSFFSGQHFPATWSVPCLISVGFCRITREHLIGVLSSTPVDPAILVRASVESFLQIAFP